MHFISTVLLSGKCNVLNKTVFKIGTIKLSDSMCTRATGSIWFWEGWIIWPSGETLGCQWLRSSSKSTKLWFGFAISEAYGCYGKLKLAVDVGVLGALEVDGEQNPKGGIQLLHLA